SAVLSLFFLSCYSDPPDLHSFPTRRSSDLRSRKLNPAMWPAGKGVRYGPAPSMNGISHSAPTVRCVCCTPFGDAVVPDVYSKRRSEEHTSELQSPYDLVCRLLLEKKKKKKR